MRKSTNYTQTTTWNKDLEAGAKLEGIYKNKEVFEGKFGESVKYVINFDGVDYGVYGSASINRQFKGIPTGSYVWIEYKGEAETKNGRTVKEYVVDFDDEYAA